MTNSAPWEVDGLPDGIRPKDFEIATTFFMTGVFWWGRRLVPTHPESPGWYFGLSGTDYEENVERLTRLMSREPMHSDKYGHYFPAVLLPDPTPSEDAKPVAVCSETGYLGSAWQEDATRLRPEVDDARACGKYMITRIRVQQQEAREWNPSGFVPSVWLPCEQRSQW